MMRRRFGVALAAGALSLSLALAGCGGGGDTTTKSTGDAGGETSVEAVDPTEKFVGEWKLAYIQAEGVTMAGDFSAMEEFVGEPVNMTLSLAADGTGSLKLNDEGSDFTWSLETDDTAKLEIVPGEEEEEVRDVSNATLVYANDEIRLEVESDEEDSSTVDSLFSTGAMVFTADGTTTQVQIPDVSAAADISEAADLVGTWNLSGFGMSKLVVLCDANSETAQSVFGESAGSATFVDGGSAKMFDEDCTWEITDGVATVTSAGVPVPMKKVEDHLLIDLGAMFGGDEYSMYLLYTK